MRVDVIGGMVSAFIIVFVIIVVTAVDTAPRWGHHHRDGNQAAAALTPFAGGLAELVFAVGVVGLGLLVVPVLAGATAYAASEGWVARGLSRTFGRRGVLHRHHLLDAGRARAQLRGHGPHPGLYYAAIVNGIAAPPLIVLMILLARSPERGPPIGRAVARGVRRCGGDQRGVPIAWLLSCSAVPCARPRALLVQLASRPPTSASGTTRDRLPRASREAALEATCTPRS